MNQLMSIFALGSNVFYRMKMFFLYAILKSRKPFFKKDFFNHLYRVRLNFQGKRFDFYIKSILDFYLLREVFVDEHYKPCKTISPPPKVIFDLGSNIGASVIYFALLFPESFVYCFEPNFFCLPSLKANLEQFSDRVKIFHAAITQESGQVTLFSNEQHWSASLYNRARSYGGMTVRSMSLVDAMQAAAVTHVDLLKFDIEGAEYDVFRDPLLSANISFMIGEIHPTITGKTINDFFTLLSKFDVISSVPAGPHQHAFLSVASDAARLE